MDNASFFPLKREKLALKCHSEDCAMNVFNFLELIPTKEAMNIANTTDYIYSHRIETFLTDTFGVEFVQETMWDVIEGENENFGEKMSNLWDKLDEILPANKGIIVFIYKEGEVGHFAVIGKIRDSMTDSIYLMDPQQGIKYLLLSKKMDQVFLDQGYEKVDAFMAHGPAKYFRPDIGKFHKHLLFNKDMNNLYAAKNANASENANSTNKNHLKRVLKHLSKGVIIHHGQLIKGNKYQIIDKKTRQQINIGTFDEVDDGIATFTNGLTPNFIIPLSDFNFINVKKSIKKTKSVPIGSKSRKTNAKSKSKRKIKSA